jgi:hypothetical protein
MRTAAWTCAVRHCGAVVRIAFALLVIGASADAQTLIDAKLANAKPADAPKMSDFIGSFQRDPLENYYDNTLVCAAAKDGQDLCHLWLYRDGSFINFDGNGAHTGHYTVGPARADGKVPVCQFWDSPKNVNPAELNQPMMQSAPPQAATPQAAAASAPGGMMCKNSNFRSDCYRGVDASKLSDADKKLVNLSMGERFYNGLCYPLGPHNVGDMWFEDDDPLPGQWGMDRLFLLPGRQ